MSQAVIDFCESLKTTLLVIENGLDRAKESLKEETAEASREARKHVEAAAEHLETFKTHAGRMAQSLRAEFPEKSASARAMLKEFGAETQEALRHAVVFLAETASKGAEGAADALRGGAFAAGAFAQKMRQETAATNDEARSDS
jgi:DNA anti-recombination protein RmuC